MKEIIGQRIREARENQRLTLREVAIRLGLESKSGVSRLSNYENGIREPDAATMIRLADVLQADPAELMFGSHTDTTQKLAAGTRHLVSALTRADLHGDIDHDAIAALSAVLAVYLRLKQGNRDSETLRDPSDT
ncbi:helix-turn-helix transcriptional regulator [Ralstonia sp. 1138]|uniref:helix-turn-helix domain-containing protein n=1 Tax=Ralstonia sp. 1138 TaxID=3156423 RepID=UPI0033921B29